MSITKNKLEYELEFAKRSRDTEDEYCRDWVNSGGSKSHDYYLYHIGAYYYYKGKYDLLRELLGNCIFED